MTKCIKIDDAIERITQKADEIERKSILNEWPLNLKEGRNIKMLREQEVAAVRNEQIRKNEEIIEENGRKIHELMRERNSNQIKNVRTKRLDLAKDTERYNFNRTLSAVRKNGYELKNVWDYFKDDKCIIFNAVSQNGLALKYVDRTIRDDVTIVLAACRNDIRALRYAGPYAGPIVRIALEDEKYGQETLLSPTVEMGGAFHNGIKPGLDHYDNKRDGDGEYEAYYGHYRTVSSDNKPPGNMVSPVKYGLVWPGEKKDKGKERRNSLPELNTEIEKEEFQKESVDKEAIEKSLKVDKNVNWLDMIIPSVARIIFDKLRKK